MRTKAAPSLISRREATRGILVAVGGAFLFGCGAEAESGAAPSSGGTGTGTGPDGDGGAATSGEWATGGTAAMAGNYADPFPLTAATCVVLTAVTEGPCTEAADQVRKDVSEGYGGLPMRLALRIVDASCNPVAGAKVKIWHTQRTGSYSGNTPNNGMCLKDSADANKHYFRGVQTTDANGRVDFDSCFPGWYRGRAIHIHFTVTANGKAFTSQLVFEQALIQSIFASHVDYASFGQPDTPNATDNIVGNGNLASFTLATSRLSDGAMMAAKEIQVNL